MIIRENEGEKNFVVKIEKVYKIMTEKRRRRKCKRGKNLVKGETVKKEKQNNGWLSYTSLT